MALKSRITRKYLKEQVGDENVFRHYFGEFEIGESYNSVFRQDNRKSTGFYVSHSGEIIYNDFRGDKYDFVKFVQQLYGLSYGDALDRIATDFGILPGLEDGKKAARIRPVHVHKPKPKPKFSVMVRKMTNKDLAYWERFSITKEELLANEIHSVEWVMIGEHKIYTKEKELKFAYFFKDSEDNGYFKIYSPYSDIWKWSNNAPLNLIVGLDKLQQESDVLIVTKSLKDYIVLKKLHTDVIALQNESHAAMEERIAKAIKKTYKKVYIFFDMDRAGIKAANWYKKHYNFTPLFLVDSRINIFKNIIRAKKRKTKDPSDFVVKHGIENLKKYLINQKII